MPHKFDETYANVAHLFATLARDGGYHSEKVLSSATPSNPVFHFYAHTSTRGDLLQIRYGFYKSSEFQDCYDHRSHSYHYKI